MLVSFDEKPKAARRHILPCLWVLNASILRKPNSPEIAVDMRGEQGVHCGRGAVLHEYGAAPAHVTYFFVPGAERQCVHPLHLDFLLWS
eukprot:scaffold173421_cov29-Tisochrysis_lutea.AAC.3